MAWATLISKRHCADVGSTGIQKILICVNLLFTQISLPSRAGPTYARVGALFRAVFWLLLVMCPINKFAQQKEDDEKYDLAEDAV